MGGSPRGGHAPEAGVGDGAGPALVPQTTLKPTETHEPNERTERTEQRKWRNSSTHNPPHFFELKRSRTENPEFK